MAYRSNSASPPVISVAAGSIHLTSEQVGEVRSIFASAIQPTTQFTASFTYQDVGGGPTFAFVLENDSRGPAAVGGSIQPSDAVEFIGNGTGLDTNGNIGAPNNLAPVNLGSGDPINVVIGYDGTFITETLTDTSTAGTSSFMYLKPAGFPTSAYVGITASTSSNAGFANDQLFSNFQFNAVPEPSSFAAALGLLVVGRYRTRTI